MSLIKPNRSFLSWTITAFFLIGVVFSVINSKHLMSIGGYLIMLGFLFGIIYSLIIKGLSPIERVFIFLMSFLQLIHFAFLVQHWNGIRYTHLLLIIPIGQFIFITFRMNGKLRNEFPFLLAMAIIALFLFI